MKVFNRKRGEKQRDKSARRTFVFHRRLFGGPTIRPCRQWIVRARVLRILVWRARTHFNPFIWRLTGAPRVAGKFLHQGRERARNAIPQRRRRRSSSRGPLWQTGETLTDSRKPGRMPMETAINRPSNCSLIERRVEILAGPRNCSRRSQLNHRRPQRNPP